MSDEFSKIVNMQHSELGPVGVNGKHFIDFEPYLKTTNFAALNQEALIGLSLVDKFDLSFVPGEIPPELRSQYGGMFLESEIMSQLEKFDPDQTHRNNMKNMSAQQRRRYCYLALGALSPWYGTCYLKRNDFKNKTQNEPSWTENAQYFPQIVEYIENMRGTIFSKIGRVLFFISYPLSSIVTHRDYLPIKHKDHCVNFYFSQGRPAYIYDEIQKKKFYLDPKCRAYFFNNRDYHGVDAEPAMRYTLRVDGTFQGNFAEKIGLKDGWVG